MNTPSAIEQIYEIARERYAAVGIDTEAVLDTLGRIPISLHCWQGDDVAGFEGLSYRSGGGIQAIGNYPGRARDADELRADIDLAMSLIPGRHRLNLHASYAETGGVAVDRDALEPEYFARWVDWAGDRGIGLDFNPTFFAHEKADSGFTLSSGDEGVRRFWVDHGIACRRIGATFGRVLRSPCVTNVWVPDGMKDTPVDRKSPRERLRRSLDEVFAEPLDPAHLRDAVEGKLFGLGSESYVVGSHEFYLGYAARKGVLLCLDAGHFHPTESVADKISSVLMSVHEVLLHVSRGVRWDSDHVVILDDPTMAIAQEVVRGDFLGRVRFGLDYFDASINRIAAWVLGCRSLLKALLIALAEPTAALRAIEAAGDYTARLVMLEEMKSLPFGALWNMHCLRQGVPTRAKWLDSIRVHEREVLANRR